VSTSHERLTLLLAKLLDDVPPNKLGQHVAVITGFTGSLDGPTQFATWHHAGLRSFVEDLARMILEEPSPAAKP
jgi:hypothetical protein